MRVNDMQNENKSYNLWTDYSAIGMSVAILLTMLDLPRDHSYLCIPVMIFIAFAGFKENIKMFPQFLKRCWFIVLAVAGYGGYYWFLNRSIDSEKFIWTVFFLILGGYMMAGRVEKELDRANSKLCVFLLAVILLGISKMVVGEPNGYLICNTIELGIAVTVFVSVLLCVEQLPIRIAGGVVSLVSVILLLKRDALHLKNIVAIKGILPAYLEGGMMGKIFGRGQLAAHAVVSEDYYENTFVTLLYDYGMLIFGLYMTAFIFAILMIIKTKDALLRKQAILVCVILAISSLFSMQYWSNSFFLIWTVIGALLGRYDQVKCKDSSFRKEEKGSTV